MILPVATLAFLAHLPSSAQTGLSDIGRIGPGASWADGAAPATIMCEVVTLVEQPGYLYTVPQIQEMVDEAEVVVRAVAVDSAGPLPHGYSWITFRPAEVLRGPFPKSDFTLRGIIAEGDDFNTRSVPCRMVRRSGQRGDCFAKDYRIGGEYLLLLKGDPFPEEEPHP